MKKTHLKFTVHTVQEYKSFLFLLNSQLRLLKMIGHYCFDLYTDSIHTIVMSPEMRAWLKKQVEVKMKREPNSTVMTMKEWLREDTSVDWTEVGKQTFHQAVTRAMEKVRTTGSTKRRPGAGGKEISLAQRRNIRRLSMNQLSRSTRKVASHVGVSRETVRKYLKNSGAKAYHRVRVQSLKPHHKADRVR